MVCSVLELGTREGGRESFFEETIIWPLKCVLDNV